MVDKLEEEKRRKLQKNEGGNEDPTAAIFSKEVKHQGQEEDDYYEEGNGGATDQNRGNGIPIKGTFREIPQDKQLLKYTVNAKSILIFIINDKGKMGGDRQ